MIEVKTFNQIELDQVNYVLNKLKRFNYDFLPIEYKNNPEVAIKHFEESKLYWEEKVKQEKLKKEKDTNERIL